MNTMNSRISNVGNILENHVHLRKYLESLFIYVPFMAGHDLELRRKYQIFSNIQLIFKIFWMLHFCYLLVNSPDDPLNYYLGDATYMLGQGRKPINLLYTILNICSLIAFIYTRFSDNLQPGVSSFWLRACEVFETGYFYEIGKFDRELWLLFSQRYVFVFMNALISLCIDMNYFLETPIKYIFWEILHFILHTYTTSLILSYLANRMLMFILLVYLHAKYFTYLSNCVENQSKLCGELIVKYFNFSKNYFGFCKFYEQSNCWTFVLMEINQVIVCYYVFFSDISSSIKFALIVILVAAHLWGTLGSFLIGTHLRNEVCLRNSISLFYILYIDWKVCFSKVIEEFHSLFSTTGLFGSFSNGPSSLVLLKTSSIFSIYLNICGTRRKSNFWEICS